MRDYDKKLLAHLIKKNLILNSVDFKDLTISKKYSLDEALTSNRSKSKIIQIVAVNDGLNLEVSSTFGTFNSSFSNTGIYYYNLNFDFSRNRFSTVNFKDKPKFLHMLDCQISWCAFEIKEDLSKIK